MLGLAVLMVTFLAFPLWCMVGETGITDGGSTSTADDATTDTEGTPA
jgi:hypothetical protein